MYLGDVFQSVKSAFTEKNIFKSEGISQEGQATMEAFKG
jgi:hypothetical protein